MIDLGKRNVLGVMVDAIDYETAVNRIISAAEKRQPLAVSAMASHGVMTGCQDLEQRYRLNHLDMIVPDGHPVRYALRLLHGVHLPDRVYGPRLMLETCKTASQFGLPIYLYGSTPEIIAGLKNNLIKKFPNLIVAGAESSRFRPLSGDERLELVKRIQASQARVVFVGLGCPRQEVWVYELRSYLSMPLLAVGAAFDFHAGAAPQAPPWMQDHSLEWLFRLTTNPKRLWKRYLGLGSLFVGLSLLQALRVREFDTCGNAPESELSFG